MYTIGPCEKENQHDPATQCNCDRCLDAERAVANFKKGQVEQAQVPPRMNPDLRVEKQSPDRSFGNRTEQ